MAEQITQTRTAPPGDPDMLPSLWWLWLPIAAILALLAVDQLFPPGARSWVGSEQGLVEFLHVVLPLAGMLVALRMLFMPEQRQHPWLWLWLALAAAGSFYVAGEEASWGQHYLQWATPESWQAINDQGETNLHNTSSWFDQKPRILLELGVVIGGILIPLAALRRPDIRRMRFAVIFPPLICLPSALLAEIARASERLLDLLDPGTQIFSRASEVQETYFYFFILLYLIVLRRRLLAGAA